MTLTHSPRGHRTGADWIIAFPLWARLVIDQVVTPCAELKNSTIGHVTGATGPIRSTMVAFHRASFSYRNLRRQHSAMRSASAVALITRSFGNNRHPSYMGKITQIDSSCSPLY